MTATTTAQCGAWPPYQHLADMVKYELSRVPVIRRCCRSAETSALLRFTGGMHMAA